MQVGLLLILSFIFATTALLLADDVPTHASSGNEGTLQKLRRKVSNSKYRVAPRLSYQAGYIFVLFFGS